MNPQMRKLPDLSGAVNYGAVNCGAVNCGAVNCGAVNCGAVNCGAVNCGAVNCGAESHTAGQSQKQLEGHPYNDLIKPLVVLAKPISQSPSLRPLADPAG
jgi:hypothetical protein